MLPVLFDITERLERKRPACKDWESNLKTLHFLKTFMQMKRFDAAFASFASETLALQSL